MKDLSSLRFGRITVLSFSHRIATNYYWFCKCDCGNNKTIQASNLKSGTTTSCGCFSLERRTRHGLRHSRLYNIYNGMVSRCTDPKSTNFKYWGGKGVKVHPQWLNDNKSFFKWAFENGYAENLQLDRIDNDADYCPENCRFVTRKDNCRNKSSNRFLEYKGESKPISQWCEELGLPYRLILGRANKSWPVDQIFNAPLYTRINQPKSKV